MSVSAPEHSANLRTLEDAILEFIRTGQGCFETLILAAHSLQRSLCAPYNSYAQAFPEPVSWREIPALPLTAFRHAEIRAFPAGETIRTFRTSGTTGEGWGEHHLRTLTLYWAAALGGWQYAGLPRENVFCLMPSPIEAAQSSLSCMAGWLASSERFFGGDWSRLIEALSQEKRGVVLFGTALAFLDLFQRIGNSEIRLPPGSVAVETGGYKGTRRSLPKSELYAIFRERLGLDENEIWNEYGMTELSSQFYSRGIRNPHHGAPWVRALVIDPESGRECLEGETGSLRIFDLANLGSCCAVQTRDLAIRRAENGFELIGRDPAALPRGCSRSADELLAQ
jgi:acyl-coenzyme A synthetase/AMP-(fatty) acid ligase